MFHPLERRSSNFQAAEAAVPEHMTSKLRNFMQMVFDQVFQSTEGCRWNVEGYISIFKTASS